MLPDCGLCEYLEAMFRDYDLCITKIHLYNFDPLNPTSLLYSKTGFKGVYITFSFLLKEANLTSTHNLCFEQKYEEYQNFDLNISFFGGKILNLLDRRVFVMVSIGEAVFLLPVFTYRWENSRINKQTAAINNFNWECRLKKTA